MQIISRRSLLEAGFAIAAGSAVSLTAIAAEQTPKDFLDAIYRTYIGKNAKRLPLDKPATVRLFTPALRKLIDDDARRAAKRNEVPNLDGDPFVDAHDWDIKSFDISVQNKASDKATGTVSSTMTATRSPDGWHIDEITTADGTLRKILSGMSVSCLCMIFGTNEDVCPRKPVSAPDQVEGMLFGIMLRSAAAG